MLWWKIFSFLISQEIYMYISSGGGGLHQFQRKHCNNLFDAYGRINQMLSRHNRIFLRPRLPSYLFIYCLHIHKTWNLNILIDNECSETMRQWRRNNHVSNKALWPQKYFPETHNIYCWYPFSSRQIVYQNFYCRKLWGESSMLLCSVYLASRIESSLFCLWRVFIDYFSFSHHRTIVFVDWV